MCDGLSNKQLGQQLNLTEGTVKVHLHKIYRRLGVRNRTALSALAMASRIGVREEVTISCIYLEVYLANGQKPLGLSSLLAGKAPFVGEKLGIARTWLLGN